MGDIDTVRVKHKMRLNILTQEEKVLCNGEPQRFALIRFFKKNVDCPECLAILEKEKIHKKLLSFLLD